MGSDDAASPAPSGGGGTEWLEVGIVARPHGVRGELKIQLHNKESDVLLSAAEVLVKLANGEEHEVSIDRARRADQAILLMLHSISDRDRAEELRGAKISVRREDLDPLEPGEFYAADVPGSRVVVTDGAKEGVVKELTSYPSVDVLVVVIEEKTYEVPLVDAYIESVDTAARLVTLKTLEGLEAS